MKKVAAILILLAFIINSFGFILLQPFLVSYYKYLGMKRASNPSDKDIIEYMIFNKEDIENKRINFQWIHSKEFRYDGNMYDIVERDEDDSLFYFYVIHDVKENKLEKNFNKKVEDNTSNSKQQTNEKNTLKILYSELLKDRKVIPDFKTQQKYNFFYTENYISAWQDVPTPPPRNC
jgi:hypothetical protein